MNNWWLELTIAKSQDSLASWQCAQPAGNGGELDHQEPPDGKAEGEPDGHGVDHDGEVGVKQEENSPGHGEHLLRVSVLIIHQVHVECEGDVLNRDQAVSHSNTGQDEVDGVGLHVLVGEDHDVEQVEDSPHAAHYHGQDTVIWKVDILNRLQVTEGRLHASEGGWRVGLGQGAGVAGLAGVELLHVIIVFLGQVLEEIEIEKLFSSIELVT